MFPDCSHRQAAAASVWAKYKAGCSVRMLHPQRFSEPLWKMLSALESFWTSAVGCNTYLTPENAQGFAPHWDDIDAFILQVRPGARKPLTEWTKIFNNF